MRIGQGYDVHAFSEGRDLYLCGEKVEYEKGLLGHSDADVALHALCDALLGAAALGDIHCCRLRHALTKILQSAAAGNGENVIQAVALYQILLQLHAMVAVLADIKLYNACLAGFFQKTDNFRAADAQQFRNALLSIIFHIIVPRGFYH